MNEPIHIISLGAGVQSSTMSLMAAAGEITPMPVAAIFADTQAEPKSVYTWLDWLEKQLPFPVYRVTQGSLISETLRIRDKDGGGVYSKSEIPAFTKSESNPTGMMPRQCTEDFKLAPIKRKVRQLLDPLRHKKAVQWIGISLDEIYRMKESRVRYVSNRWPLVDLGMNRSNCLDWMTKRGFPKPPRSACVFCPYHSNAEWRRLKNEEPKEFQRAVDFERDFQNTRRQTGIVSMPYLHASRVPLSEVDFSTEEERGQLSMFNNECEGMCGV